MRLPPQLYLQTLLMGAGSEWTPPSGCWFFGCVADGFGYYFCRDGPIDLTSGMVVVSPPLASYILRSSQLSALRFNWFVLDLNRLYGVLTLSERGWLGRAYDVRTASKTFTAGPESELVKAFARALASIDDGSHAISHRAVLLSVVALYLTETMPRRVVKLHPFLNSTERLEHLLGTMTEAEFLALSAEELAEACHCDRRRILQIFRQVIGSSFRDRQSDLRKLRVSQMMEQGASLPEIALECGYDTPEGFRAWFRRAFGTGLNRWADAHQLVAEEQAGTIPSGGAATSG